MYSCRHVFHNPNPTASRDSADCVVRALSVALDLDWDTVYRDLCDLGFALKRMPNDRDTYRTCLTNAGMLRTGISNKKGSRRPTVDSFARTNPQGVFVLEIAHHLVTVRDGRYYDTWDCGSKSLYGYWAAAK